MSEPATPRTEPAAAGRLVISGKADEGVDLPEL